MKSITLAQAFAILEAAANDGAAIVNHCITDRIYLDAIKGQADNQFAYIKYADQDGVDFAVKFSEGPNTDVSPQVDGSKLFLTDDEGDTIELTILMPASLE